MPASASVIVVVFDQLAAPADNDAPCPALDALELESAYFEQFHVQDLRHEAGLDAWLGGQDAVNAFGRELEKLGLGVAHLKVECCDRACSEPDGTETNQHPLAMQGAPSWLSSPTVISVLGQDLEAPGADASGSLDRVGDCLTSALLWVTIPGENLSSQVVDRVMRMLGDAVPREATMLVTSLRRRVHAPGDPFPTGKRAYECIVPLWIRTRDRQCSRVQTHCGSHDVLPTLIALFFPEPEASAPGVPQLLSPDPNSSSAPPITRTKEAEHSLGPISLIDLIHSPGFAVNRRIDIVGDDWKAVRSSRFLLVIDQSSPLNVENRSAAEASRQLFQQRDDPWHVHDVLATFPDVADELEAAGR